MLLGDANRILNLFKIRAKADAFISQVKVAELCGVARSSLQDYIFRNSGTLELNEINQLSANSLEQAAAFYAFESRAKNSTALSSYRTLAKAGAKAYIYSQAGYVFSAEVQPVPQFTLPTNYLEALKALLTFNNVEVYL